MAGTLAGVGAMNGVRRTLELLRLRAVASLDTTPEARPASDPLDEAPLDVLAAKILFAHLRNRQQMLGPPPTAFGQLDEGQTELLIRAAIAAAYADGHLTDAEERQLRGALSASALHAAGRNFVDDAIRTPVPLELLLRDVRDVHVASLFYAASLLAIDKHDDVNRAYLTYLARRLSLPAEVLERLHSQHGFAT